LVAPQFNKTEQTIRLQQHLFCKIKILSFPFLTHDDHPGRHRHQSIRQRRLQPLHAGLSHIRCRDGHKERRQACGCARRKAAYPGSALARLTSLELISNPQSSSVMLATFRVETPWTYISARESRLERSSPIEGLVPGCRDKRLHPWFGVWPARSRRFLFERSFGLKPLAWLRRCSVCSYGSARRYRERSICMAVFINIEMASAIRRGHCQ
jgi:hypothetical protein